MPRCARAWIIASIAARAPHSRAMSTARRACVFACVFALVARASSARAISREDAFVGYSERARASVVRLTLDGDGNGDARVIALRLREDWAPTLARELADGAARGGRFYRAEGPPEAGARDGYGGPGPPYALLQGTLEGLRGQIEGTPPIVERGYACMIGSGPDFFIATRGHAEWGRAHACFAEADEATMALVDEITETYAVHPETWGRTNVTVLNEKLPFSSSIE
jgi:hypothetical protein